MTVAEPGVVEIKFSDLAEANPVTVWTNHTNVVGCGAKTYPTGANADALPYTSSGAVASAKVRGRILVYFTSDAADTIESEDCGAHIPIILYDEKTGKPVQNKTLTFNNMTGFTVAGTVDIVCAAGVPVRVCYYDVPRGLVAGLDPRGKIHAYMSDDT